MRAIVVVAVLMLGATEASARKFHFFHVSGGGGGEQIVKVLELPDIPALRRADGRHIDLGYKFKSGGGEWVGYVGDDGKYLPLSGDAVHALLAVAGIDRLPPVPERPASTESGVSSVFKAILMLFGFSIILYWIYSFFAGALGWVARLFSRGKTEAAEAPNVDRTNSDPTSPSFTSPVSFAKPAAGIARAGGGMGVRANSIPARAFGRRAQTN
jgi:hypothetical protein